MADATDRLAAGEAVADDQSVEGASDRQKFESSDPAVMRSLAHPLRIELLELLDQTEEATASELAEQLGQSVANCSFHLRILASGGFIERAEPRGREKPWRVTHKGGRDLRPNVEDKDSVRESAQLGAMVVQRESARVMKFLREVATRDPEPQWVHSVTVSTSTFWATAEEMVEFAREVSALTERFQGRADPAKRPEGARKAKLFATLNPELTPPGIATDQETSEGTPALAAETVDDGDRA